ncbi:MAG: hypothetical protein H0T92_05515 [Pyrinomonadaceae bacterium]|nr:hypothetical protein [Pyrinomonadaceae bacterium]
MKLNTVIYEQRVAASTTLVLLGAVLLCAAAGTLVAGSPRPVVRVHSQSTSDAIKVVRHMRMPIFGGVIESDSTEWITPQMKRDDSVIRMKGGFLGVVGKMAGGNAAGITITRLDKGVAWQLDPKKKTYQESSLSTYRDVREQQMETSRLPKKAVRLVDSDFKVTSTGQERTLNGWPCKQFITDGYLEFEDIESKVRSRWTFHNEQWNTEATPLLKAFQETELAFHHNYIAKIGLATEDAAGRSQEMVGALGRLLGISQAQLTQAAAKMAREAGKISGVSVADAFRWDLGAGGAKAESSGEQEEGKRGGGLLGALGRMAAGKGAGLPGGGVLSIQGAVEIKSLDKEAGDFEIPESYHRR